MAREYGHRKRATVPPLSAEHVVTQRKETASALYGLAVAAASMIEQVSSDAGSTGRVDACEATARRASLERVHVMAGEVWRG